MQRIRETDTALIKGSRNLIAAPNQQQLNYVPCFIPAGNRISELCCKKQILTGNSPLYMWGWYSSTSLLHFLFKSKADKIWRLSSSKGKHKFCAVHKRLQISVYLTGFNPYYSLSWQNPKGSYI